MASYEEALTRNIAAYDAAVDERASGSIAPWKLDEHEAFSDRLAEERRSTIVEVGAGTGFHSQRFADAGFDVLATDPSPAMVAYCRSLGLEAMETDVIGLRLDEPRDAAFSMNSLLHVPVADFPRAIGSLQSVIRPGGLVYIGMYGGVDEEGVRDGDHYVPKRWFVSHSDERLLEFVSSVFEVVDFHRVDVGGEDDFHFQSLTLRR